jgi:hypothetical protein
MNHDAQKKANGNRVLRFLVLLLRLRRIKRPRRILSPSGQVLVI